CTENREDRDDEYDVSHDDLSDDDLYDEGFGDPNNVEISR
ncbi:hypothetical protein A2U01_0055088, partial [Trifolium medium]|nr:hypothetical protein [Trifolium medium]